MELVTRSAQGSTGQELTASGLAGDTDIEYFIRARIIIPSAGSANVLRLRPNGATSNLRSRYSANQAPSTAGTDAIIANLSSSFTGAPLSVLWWIHCYAAKTLNGVTVQRGFWCRGQVIGEDTNTLGTYALESDITWDETATELTSLVFRSNDANGIEAGSEMLVFKPTVTFGA